jgi:GST-like protein
MIDLHYWPTPNGWKISIMLEECGLPYRLVPVNIGKGEQFAPEFLAISPNNRMPAIVDHAPAGGGAPVAVFESGAILMYLAEKTGRFLPTELRERYQAMQWLMWQMGGLGPMAGQNGHFFCMHRTKSPMPSSATARKWIAFTACSMHSWHAPARMLPAPATPSPTWPSSPGCARTRPSRLTCKNFPHVQRWYDALFERPAVKRGLDLGKELRAPALTEEARKALFGQTAQSVRDGAHKVS